jgi:pyruvate/2-oxoglutarate dehydrogenase complex dihydrolipoamide dehydrogenase (E3) component
MTDARDDALDEIESDFDVEELAREWREHVEIQDRRYRLRTYEDCFVGSEACEWLVESGHARDLEQAEMIGNVLLNGDVFHHVLREHEFKNDHLFYRFTEDETHGRRAETSEGQPVSWEDFLGTSPGSERGSRLQPDLSDQDEGRSEMTRASAMEVDPLDAHNVELLDQVHPPAWVDPEPADRYNTVVVGAGTGGLVMAAAVAGLGGEVALVEEHLMGGDCLNFGCVPSKTLLRSAKAAERVREAEDFGVHVEGDVRIDFEEVMERVREVRARISHHDSAERFAKELGIDVFLGHAEFTGPETIEVEGTELNFARACIATGASPAVPPIPGLEEVPYRTNLDLFNLTERPPRFGVVGGGVIGTEMSQAFQRLGSSVTLIEQRDHVLPREETDAAEVVQASLVDDGVDLRLETAVEQVSHEPAGADASFPTIRLELSDGSTVEVDALLVATGRKPNVEGLGLESAGVAYDETDGIEVDDHLQTTNGSIYAVGDVATRYQFTHAADFMARIAVRNAHFFGRDHFSDLLIPWCTYTDPEIAHVGLYPEDLESRGISYETFEEPFDEVDRAIAEGATEGVVRLHVEEGDDAILGATVVGPRAGELICELTLAMQHDIGLGELADVIHPYPTFAEAIRRVGDQYNRTRLTPTVQKLLRQVLEFRR